MAVRVLEIFGTSISYFTMLCKLTKNVCFLSSGGDWNFVYGAITPEYIIFVDKFFIPLMVEELFLLNQEHSYVMFN